MKKMLLIVAVLLGCSALSIAQIQVDGTPFSWKGKMTLSDRNINTVSLPTLNMNQVYAEDVINDASGNLQRMTVLQSVNLNPNNSGTWFNLPTGDRVWKLRIESPNARAISLLFDQWNLPEGAQLYVYNEAHTDLLGAYTSVNNKAHGQMTVQPLIGEVAIIEYMEPANAAGQTVLNINQVGHCYRQIYRGPNHAGDLRGSDPCEVDVNCSEGNAWQDQISGACRIYVVSNGGAGWCSGTLINNTAQDCKPYILTALHCGVSSTAANFNSYIFYFNYESSGCGTGAAPTNQSITGCTKIADSGDGGGNSGSDFLLVELNSGSAETTLKGWNAYWNGWNAANVGSTSGVSIHHPAGDRKKISTYSTTLTSTQWGSASGSHWLVDWVGTTNGHGVTEGGSSGSPIFDSNKRVVGQLTGGSSYCTQVPNTSPDLYGKMSYNWNSNPGDDLDDYLDPGNTGATTLDGSFDPCTPLTADDAGISAINYPTGTACGATFSPIVTIRNFGSTTLASATINYQLDGGAVQTYSWTGSLATNATEAVTLPAVTTSSGAHTFDAYTTLPNGSADGNAGNDAAGQASFNVNVTGVSIDFTLVTDCWGSETTWEVQNGSGTVLYSGGPYTDITGGETINETWCLSDGCYDFIINDTYGDGMYGSQYGSCSVDGSYTIVDQGTGTTLASILAANSDFGNSETNNFCVASTLAANFNTNNTTVCAGSSISFTDQSSGGPVAWAWTFAGGTPSSSTMQNPSITYNTPGTYNVSLTVTDGGGSTANNTQTGYITVVSNPTGTVSSTDETCAGACDGSITASISGGTTPYSYVWTNGGGSSASNNAVCAGSYNLVVTDNNGCTVSGLSTTVNAGSAAPTASFTANPTTVYISNGGNVDFTNTSTGGTTYAWDFGDSGTSTLQDPSHVYTVAGTYTVTLTVTGSNGCIGTASTQITVLLEDGITEGQLNNAVSLYPNPTNGQLFIGVEVDQADAIFVEVFNSIGELITVVKAEDNQSNLNVDLSSNAKGLYYVTIHVDAQQVTRKVSLIK